MKKIKYLAIAALVASCTGIFSSCTDGNDWNIDSSASQVLSPSGLKIEKGSGSLTLTFTKNGGSSFLVEASETPFSTNDQDPTLQEGSIRQEVEGSPAVITGLKGYTTYYVRLRAQSDSKNPSCWLRYCDSKTGENKSVRTNGLNIFDDPVVGDTTTTSIRMHWINWQGAAVSPTKITASYYENGIEKLVASHDLNGEKEYTFEGLTPNTEYTIQLYQNDEIVGLTKLSTKYDAPTADKTVNFSEITGGSITQAMINGWMPSGVTSYKVNVIIPAGSTLKTSDAITIPEGMSIAFIGKPTSSNVATFNPKKQIYVKKSNGYLQFVNLTITPQGNYNIVEVNSGSTSTAASVDQILFKSCKAIKLTRGLVDFNNLTTGSPSVTIDDCILASNSGTKPLIAVEGNNASIASLNIKNSTVYNWTSYLIRLNSSTNNTGYGDINISDCTFYNVSDVNSYFVDINNSGASTLTFTNVINSAIMSGKFRYAGTINFDAYYELQDVQWSDNEVFTAGDTEGTKLISGDASKIFKNPTSGDFTLKGSLAGNSKIGDPRWYNK